MKVVLPDEELHGILMPRPKLLDEGFIVLKLDTGYNIGMDKKKIKSIETVKAYAPKQAKKGVLKHDPKLPNISLISFGGTISSRIDYRTGGVFADYSAEDFVSMCPELKDIANLKAIKSAQVMSEDFCHEDWQSMAKVAAKELNSGAEGVILTQGTDTLHFSAAALSFMLRGLNKPVIFTASQRSIDRGSSDAFMNLVCSAHAASKLKAGAVMTCMHGTTSDDYCTLVRGTKVRKMHTSRRDAFRPINDLPMAKVFPDGRIETAVEFPPAQKGDVVADTKFEGKTALVQIHPGMDPGVIDYYIDRKFRGIVLAATALGHVPTNSKKNVLDQLERAKQEKIPIIIASQTLYGRVHPYVYTNLRKLSVEKDCIFVEDMLPETAFVKLGWVLGHTKDIKDVRKQMLTNMAGEITERTLPESYLC